MPPVQQPSDKRPTPLVRWTFAIVLIIAAALFFSRPTIVSPSKAARRASTEATLETIASLLHNYNLENGSYPRALDALVPKYLEKPPTDGWKHPLVYTLSPSGPPFSLGSLGADGQTGGSGDNADIWTQLP